MYIREYVPRYYVGLDTFRYIGRAALYMILECIGMYMPNLQTCTFWCHWPMKSRYASHGFSFTCQCWKIPLFHIHAADAIGGDCEGLPPIPAFCVWRWSCTLIHRSLLFLWPTRTNPQVSTLIRVVSYLFRAHRMANIDIYMLESFFPHLSHLHVCSIHWPNCGPVDWPSSATFSNSHTGNFAAGSQAPVCAWGFASVR